MDAPDQMQEGRVVGLWVGGEDAEADGEQVDLDCEGVEAGGGHETFAEFAEGGEEEGDGWVRWRGIECAGC